MKRLVLIIAIAMVSLNTHAQLSYGGQVGANLGLVSTEDAFLGITDVKIGPRIGFIVGGLAEVNLIRKLSFRPELNVIQKSFKRTFEAGASTTEQKYNMNFIELPLMVLYNMKENEGKGYFYLGAGPTFALGISGKNKWKVTEPGEPDHTGSTKLKFDGNRNIDDLGNSIDRNEHFKRTDVGISVMAGYRLPMGLFANISFTQGIKDLATDNNTTYVTSGFALKIGYLLNHNRATN